MRCDSCNKFVSFDSEVEPEINIDVTDDGVVTGDVRIVNGCAECSAELTEVTMTVEADLSEQITAHREECKADPANTDKHDTLEVEAEGERFDRMQTTDRSGKPIKNPRYQKHMYGVSLDITVTCECGAKFTADTWSDEVQGSGMDSLQ
jgi:hypothetical protein